MCTPDGLVVAIIQGRQHNHNATAPALQAVQAYRIANWMWKKGRREVAFDLQGRVASAFNGKGRGLWLCAGAALLKFRSQNLAAIHGSLLGNSFLFSGAARHS